MKSKLELLTIVAMACGVVGTVAFCAGASAAWVGVLVSGLLLFFIRLRGRMTASEFVQRRIHSILMFSAVAICVCAYFMMNGKSYWPIPLLVSACVELYSSFRLN